MINQPLGSSDQTKIMMFSTLMLPTILFLIGIVPALFLIFGIMMMKKNKDFSHIITAVKSFRWYVGFVLIGCLAVSFFLFSSDYFYEEDAYLFLALAVTCCVYLILVKFLFVNPLYKHKNWVELHGIFTTRTKDASQILAQGDTDSIGGDKLKYYSAADELTKWIKLKEEGHISEEEFNQARKKLL